jgi:hypothetical protein
MDIKVEIVKENEDGSADALVHFDKEGLEMLVQYGILAMLKQAIEDKKPKRPVKTYTGGKPNYIQEKK